MLILWEALNILDIMKKALNFNSFVGTALSYDGLERVIGGGWGCCQYASGQPNVKNGCDCANFSENDQSKKCNCGHPFSDHYDYDSD